MRKQTFREYLKLQTECVANLGWPRQLRAQFLGIRSSFPYSASRLLFSPNCHGPALQLPRTLRSDPIHHLALVHSNGSPSSRPIPQLAHPSLIALFPAPPHHCQSLRLRLSPKEHLASSSARVFVRAWRMEFSEEEREGREGACNRVSYVSRSFPLHM